MKPTETKREKLWCDRHAATHTHARLHYETAPVEILSRRSALEATCARYDVPLPAAALQFPLRHPAVVSVVVGARSPEEIDEDARLLEFPVPDELWSEIDAYVT